MRRCNLDGHQNKIRKTLDRVTLTETTVDIMNDEVCDSVSSWLSL